jgi:hypothetical protein
VIVYWNESKVYLANFVHFFRIKTLIIYQEVFFEIYNVIISGGQVCSPPPPAGCALKQHIVLRTLDRRHHQFPLLSLPFPSFYSRIEVNNYVCILCEIKYPINIRAYFCDCEIFIDF